MASHWIKRLFLRNPPGRDKTTGDSPASEEALDDLIRRGNLLEDQGDVSAALGLYREASRIDPASARAVLNTGNAQLALGDAEAAIRSFVHAAALDPASAPARFNLGNTFLAAGRFEEALTAYRCATELRPEWAEAWTGVGLSLEAIGRPAESLEAFARAARLQPGHPGIARNLAQSLAAQGRTREATDVLERALGGTPGEPLLERELAALERQSWHPGKAIARYRRLLSAAPADFALWSDLLFTLNLSPDETVPELLGAHRAFGKALAASVSTLPPISRASGDRIRIGYVSADLRRHPVASFLLPLLENHDRAAFEVYCYSNTSREDEMTLRLRGGTDHWRDIRALDDDRAAALIRQDRIDVLIDLSGHTGGNRLPLFARRPARAHCTWLGYLGTTGVDAIDFRICDAHTDPVGVAEAWHTERLLRLPHSQWCYRPSAPRPLPARSPRATNGFWTFGSFNQSAKINPPVITAWAGVLREIPDSRLRLVGITDEDAASAIMQAFEHLGVDRERLQLEGRVSLDHYFQAIEEVDFALDTFPYTGGTTTCDALYLGVPVLAVSGDRSIARSSTSLLRTAGMASCIAADTDALPMVAIELVQEADSDAFAYRVGVATAFRNSPLRNETGFARDFEQLIRQACADAPG